jgi:hypothetical protein
MSINFKNYYLQILLNYRKYCLKISVLRRWRDSWSGGRLVGWKVGRVVRWSVGQEKLVRWKVGKEKL